MGGLYSGVSLFRFQNFFRFRLVSQHAIAARYSRFLDFAQWAALARQVNSFIPRRAAKSVSCGQQFFRRHANRYSQQNLTSAAGIKNITTAHSATPSNSSRIPSVFTSPSLLFSSYLSFVLLIYSGHVSCLNVPLYRYLLANLNCSFEGTIPSGSFLSGIP